jgi:hypothetical protein
MASKLNPPANGATDDATPDRRRDWLRKEADAPLILRLLAGFKDDNGVVVTDYDLTPDEEKQARAALARGLRSGIRGFSQELLALAIDPDTPSSWPGMHPTRKIKFENVGRGPPSNWARDILIVEYISAQRRRHMDEHAKKWCLDERAQIWRPGTPPWKEEMESYYEDARKHFNVSRSTAQAVCLKHEKLLNWDASK